MRKWIKVFLVLLIGFSCNVSWADEHVAFFKNVTGKVNIIRAHETVSVQSGTQLFKSDTIVTENKTTAGIVFRDGTLLTLGENTQVEIKNYLFEPAASKYDFSLYMKKGSAIYSSGTLAKLSPESVKLDTPRASVGVRGTRFILTADD